MWVAASSSLPTVTAPSQALSYNHNDLISVFKSNGCYDDIYGGAIINTGETWHNARYTF